jgi:hypothetical protein
VLHSKLINKEIQKKNSQQGDFGTRSDTSDGQQANKSNQSQQSSTHGQAQDMKPDSRTNSSARPCASKPGDESSQTHRQSDAQRSAEASNSANRPNSANHATPNPSSCHPDDPQWNWQHGPQNDAQRSAEAANSANRSNSDKNATPNPSPRHSDDSRWKWQQGPQAGESFNRDNSHANPTSHQGTDGIEEIVTVYEKCPPRIDELQNRVILQEKAIVKQGNRVVRETPCQDTFETFVIKRDYICRDCEDRVDYITKQAFSRYRKYWVDAAGQRHELNNRLYVEEDNPHPFLAERGQCTASIKLDLRKAHPQIQTVYYGRGNKRVIVENCHDDSNAQPVDIVETAAQCTPVHFLDLKASKEQKRDVYVLDRVEHEVTPCHQVGNMLPHHFDSSLPCKAIKNLASRSLIHTGKRFITLLDGKRVDISSHCEPFGDPVALHFTTEGCVGYQHDFNANQSYALGRWHYLNGYQKIFVSKCIPGGEALVHHFECVGYKHIDQQKISYPVYKIWIRIESADLILKQRQTRPDRGQYAYIFNREETCPYNTPRIEGHALITPLATYHIYTRQDGSEFKEFIKDAGEKREEIPQVTAKRVEPKPQPKEITERKNVFEYTIDSFSFDRKQYKCTHVEISDNAAAKFYRPSPCNSDPADVFGHKEHNCYIYQRPCVQVRKKIIGSDGKETVTPWVNESVGKNYAPYCYVMSGGAYYNTHKSGYPGGSPHVPAQPNRIN